MAKEKAKGAKGVANKHLHARISFLQQAASYLTLEGHAKASSKDVLPSTTQDGTRYQTNLEEESPGEINRHETDSDDKNDHGAAGYQISLPSTGGLARHVTSQLRQVALKSQIRLHPTIKHSSCKTCDAVLIEGQTCQRFTENLSRGGRKPQADVLILRCCSCGTDKRFPIGAKRQLRKTQRKRIEKVSENAKDGGG